MAGCLDGREGGHQGPDRLRDRQQPDQDPGDHAHRPLRADQHPEQVESGPVGVVAAHPVDGPVGQHHLHPDDVVGGDPVVQAVRPARVLGGVAADRAGLLGGWVGRVEKALPGRLDAEIGVDHAGLHHRSPARLVDLQDPVHAGQRQRDPAAARHRAAGEPGAGAASDERDRELARQLHERGDVLRGAREGDQIGRVREQLLNEGDTVVAEASGKLEVSVSVRAWPADASAMAATNALASVMRIGADDTAPLREFYSTHWRPGTSSSSHSRHSASEGIWSVRSKRTS